MMVFMRTWVLVLLILPALSVHGQIPFEKIPCPVFPADNVWNTPIDKMPLDPNSKLYVSTIGADQPLHNDFLGQLYRGASIGIPYMIVPGDQAKIKVEFQYKSESDPGPYPIPESAMIEAGSDAHVLLVDRDSCKLYELFGARKKGDKWTAGSGAIFNLKSNELRRNDWTSADAAGLPILPGLVRYDEVAAGEIAHAIRFTAPTTRDEFVWPGRHQASNHSQERYPPMGQRFRLKASFEISGFSREAKVILRAFKKYGIILADNGSPWYITGTPDSRWNDDHIAEIKKLHGSDFEAVDESSLMVSKNSGQAKPQPRKD